MEYRIVNDTQLYHYGVPGMKWGVRKAPERSAIKAKVKGANAVAFTKYRSEKKAIKKNKNIGLLEKNRRIAQARLKYDAQRDVNKRQGKLERSKLTGNNKKINKQTEKLKTAKDFKSAVNTRAKQAEKGYSNASKKERIAAFMVTGTGGTTYYAARGRGESKAKAAMKQIGSDLIGSSYSGRSADYIQSAIASEASIKKKKKSK